MQEESGELTSEIEHRRASEAKYLPGSTTLDRIWKGHEAKLDAQLPMEEAGTAARAAGEVAADADQDRHAIEQDVGRMGPAGATPTVQRELAEVEQLADDAISAGLRTSQDALDAKVAYKTKAASAAKAAEDAAQNDLGRASHDLAEEDALLKEVESETQENRPGS